MKIGIITLILISTIRLSAQDKTELYKKFLYPQFEGQLIEIKDENDSMYFYDFSKIWTVKNIKVSPDYFNPERPEPLGYIGEKYQRLFIHFSDVKKESDTQYLVSGKSRVKKNICDFKGYITIESIKRFDIEYLEGADYVIDPRTIKQGLLIGSYTLYEDSMQNHSGVFKGVFVSSFYIARQGLVEYNVTSIFSDNYRNNQFKGIWKPYNSTNSKQANWGDYLIPNSGDLNIGAGGFSPNDRYLSSGWQNYREAYWSIPTNEEAKKDEEQKWWNE